MKKSGRAWIGEELRDRKSRLRAYWEYSIMFWVSLLVAGLALLLLLAGTGLALAQTGGGYDLTWWTVDGGGLTGSTDAGNKYLLLHTAGQPDAALPISGGSYTIESGFWPDGAKTEGKVYLPLILQRPLPDLVGTVSLNPPLTSFQAGQPVQINVVVTNIGIATAGEFWVDLYISPSAPPTVNQRWNDLCKLSPCYGMAWYVEQNLGPGQSVNLSSNTVLPDYSRWPGGFAAGTTELYLYADSWNPTVATGGVLESNETNNRFYLGGLSVSGLGVAADEPPPSPIPPRPARLK